MDGLGEAALDRYGMRPRSTADGVALCEAALDIGAQPARFGVAAVDAYQMVRIFYAA